jgi:hypothetical protein
VIKNLVTTATPLLRAAGDCEKIILSPLPRYLKSCWDAAEHLSNKREKRKYCKIMGEAIGEMKDSIRHIVFGKKIKSFKVLSPLLLLADDEEPDTYDNLRYFQEDPVHLAERGYTILVEAISKTIEDGTFTRASRSGAATPAPATSFNLGRGAKIDRSLFKRRGWVNRDNTLAHRNYGNNNHWHTPRGRASASGGRRGNRAGYAGLGARGGQRGHGGRLARGGHGKSGFGRGHRSWPY